MTKTRRIVAGGAVILGLLVSCPIADAQVDQRSLAQQLHEPQGERRTKALREVSSIAVAELEDDLRIALISALARLNQIVLKAALARQPLDQVEDPLFIAALSRHVATLRDPRAISALSEAIYGGSVVARALAEFGEPAVPALLRVVTSSDSNYDLVDHALIALRMIAERPDYKSISNTTDQQIKAAAAQRLHRPGYFTSLWRAIDLGAVLRDPGLRLSIERLAHSADAVSATAIALDANLIRLTQKWAAERLAGIPPTPR